jgi:F0F1-type ATP synthase membrane subunit b/b'
MGREPPRTDEDRPIEVEEASTAANGNGTARDEVFASASAMAGRRATSRRADARGLHPFAPILNADLGLASFTAATAFQCARLDLLVGDLAMAEEEFGRAYAALGSGEESCVRPPISEPRAELLDAGARGETGEIPRAAEGRPASDVGAPRARRRPCAERALDWRQQADEAEWRAREALDLVRIGAALARLSSRQPRRASGEGERGASARCAWPPRRPIVTAPGPARDGVLREILANENLPDGYARELALEMLDLPEELWGARSTIDPLSDLIRRPNRVSRARTLVASGGSRALAIGTRPSGIGHTRSVADDEAPHVEEEASKLAPPREEDTGLAELQARVPDAIRNVSFPTAGRSGYERRAVDSYVNQVNRLIAELEVGRSPQAAVRHALDRVGEQTKALLRQARETAEEITSGAREDAEGEVARAKAEAKEISARAEEIAASAREEAEAQVARAQAEANEISARASAAGDEAEGIVAGAKSEAEGIVTGAKAEADKTMAAAKTEADQFVARAHAEAEEVLSRSRAEAAERLRRLEDEIASARQQAETRIQELHAETEAVWKERHELLDEIHAMGTRLLEVASQAAGRVSPAERSDEATPEAVPASEAESAQA